LKPFRTKPMTICFSGKASCSGGRRPSWKVIPNQRGRSDCLGPAKASGHDCRDCREIGWNWQVLFEKYTFSKLPKCSMLSEESKKHFLKQPQGTPTKKKSALWFHRLNFLKQKWTMLWRQPGGFPFFTGLSLLKTFQDAGTSFLLSLAINLYILFVWEWIDGEWSAREVHLIYI
jgi:hypothetical protein